MSKLWGGRFEKELDNDAKALSYTLHIDKRLAPYDIAVNKAQAKALIQSGVFTQKECDDVTNALNEIDTLFKTDESSVLGADEDIHSCIERLVTERCGDLGKKLHTGKSRNDQVVTDTRLFVKDAIEEALKQVDDLLKAVYQLAKQNESVIFPGFTHFQPALPVLLSHHLLAYFNKFERDKKRLEHALKTTDVCPLGSGAMAGNNYKIDRDFLKKELGFSSVSTNSMDAVSDRDFILEFFAASTIMMTHLSRFCEEIVVWNSPLLGFIEIGDEFTTGSSIMPQKKNPDIAELIRGKSGRVLGHMVSLIHTLKSLPLTYNRDLQEDKECLFDTADTLILSTKTFAKMLNTIIFKKDAINEALKKGYLLATDFADYLVKKQVPFRESHDITGQVVLFAIKHNKQLEELSLEEFHQFSTKVEEDVYTALTVEAAVAAKNVFGGTAPNQVAEQLNQIKETYKWNNH